VAFEKRNIRLYIGPDSTDTLRNFYQGNNFVGTLLPSCERRRRIIIRASASLAKVRPAVRPVGIQGESCIVRAWKGAAESGRAHVSANESRIIRNNYRTPDDHSVFTLACYREETCFCRAKIPAGSNERKPTQRIMGRRMLSARSHARDIDHPRATIFREPHTWAGGRDGGTAVNPAAC